MEYPYPIFDRNERYKKSWTAYIDPTVRFVVLFGIGIGLLSFCNWYDGAVSDPNRWTALPGTVLRWIGIIFIFLAPVRYVLRVLSLYSVVLFTNDQGVWVYSGVFPWKKGVSGIKWRYVEQAEYHQNALGWLFGASRVYIRHRFTVDSDIDQSYISKGSDAVIRINQLHDEHVASNGMA